MKTKEIRWLGKEMDNATEYPWAGKLPKGFARMTPRACFGNAMQLVFSRDGLRYAEGEAWKEGMWRPVHHAWVLDENDQAIDVTWTRRSDSPRIYRAAVIATREELGEHWQEYGGGYYMPYLCCMSDHCWCINLLDNLGINQVKENVT